MSRINTNKLFEPKLLNALIRSKLVKHVVVNYLLRNVNQEILMEMLETPSKLSFDENGLYFKNANNNNNNTIKCPSDGVNLQANGKWLSDKIMDLTFDVEQVGNLRLKEPFAVWLFTLLSMTMN